MQLALFMKLARFAREAVFVGDMKQAIFGFRGSDPRLVQHTLEALRSRGSSPKVLNASWRSRPSLTRYLNTVFAEAFERDDMKRELVELSPKRAEAHDAPAVVRWTLPKTQAKQVDALASAITALQTSGHRVEDPKTGQPRAATFGDIAVLAATNGHVQSIAKALRDHQVPVKMTLFGLLDTPEVCLARACLRRLNDPADTIATAEIRALGSCDEPKSGSPIGSAGSRLTKGGRTGLKATIQSYLASPHLSGQTVTQSPVEIVARVLNYVAYDLSRRLGT